MPQPQTLVFAGMVTVTITYDDDNDVRRSITLPAEDWDGTYELVMGVPVPTVATKYLSSPVCPNSNTIMPDTRVKKVTWVVA
jgi:hypothetical protein